MAKLSYLKGATSVTVNVFIQDSTSTTGGGKTGLAYNTSNLIAYYAREKAASAAITLATQTTTGAWSSGGFVEIDATHMAGLYRLDIPDAALATGSNSAAIILSGATGMAPLVLEIELEGVDRRDAVGFGLSRLDAAITTRLAPATAGRTLVVDAAGLADANMVKVGPTGSGTAQTAGDIIGDTNDIQARLPAALVSGRMDSSVGAMAANVMTAAAAAADLTTELQSGLSTLDAAGVRTAVGMASANLDTQLGLIAGYIDTEVGTLQSTATAIKAKTDNLPASPAAVGSAMTLTSDYEFAKGTVAMTEAYAADGAIATPAQMLYMLWALMAEKSVASTTLTAKKLDGSTTAMTFTLDSAAAPTSITRAT